MPPPQLAGLEADLAAEQSELDLLVAALERERAALAAGIGDEVERVAADKEKHAAAVTSLGMRREARLAACGLGGGMRELLERFPEYAALRRAWPRLLDTARQAKVMNDANGRLVAAHARHLNGRLAALAGPTACTTYGPTGASRPGGARRSLGAI